MDRQRIQIVAAAVAALTLGGGGFVAGMTLGPSLSKGAEAASPSPGAAQGQRQQVVRGAGGAAGQVGGGPAGQTVTGRVISVQDGSITVETRQPGSDTTRSTIALVGSSARLVKTAETEIKLADIKPGDQVVISGTTDASTGTVSANAVIVGGNPIQQILGGERPAGAPGGGGRVPPASASPRP
jgi:F0F1-type ATP synthase membrane subunit c/vacuolar-type H+-ATPase subunit K